MLCFGEWSDVCLGMVWFTLQAVVFIVGGGLHGCVAWVATLRNTTWCAFQNGRSALSVGGG